MAKMLLKDAAQLVGLSVNGMRSRAKADPMKWGLTVDNTGRLWVEFDPVGVLRSKPAARSAKGSKSAGSKATLEGRIAVLETQLEAMERARVVLQDDRDQWRRMAETLAAKRWRFWPF